MNPKMLEVIIVSPDTLENATWHLIKKSLGQEKTLFVHSNHIDTSRQVSQHDKRRFVLLFLKLIKSFFLFLEYTMYKYSFLYY